MTLCLLAKCQCRKVPEMKILAESAIKVGLEVDGKVQTCSR